MLCRPLDEYGLLINDNILYVITIKGQNYDTQLCIEFGIHTVGRALRGFDPRADYTAIDRKRNGYDVVAVQSSDQIFPEIS